MKINFTPKEKMRAHHYFIPHPKNGHKPHFMRHKALHFYSALLIAVKVMVMVLLFVTYPSPAEFSTITTNRIIELTNEVRKEQGLPVLMKNDKLSTSAIMKAKDMVQADYFAHDNPANGDKPWEWFKQAGYNYTFAGENLAMNFSDAKEAFEAWMASPTHQANILNPNYREIGVAVLVGEIDGKKTTLVVQHFGKSFVSSGPAFVGSQGGQPTTEGEIAGITQVSGGEAIEVKLEGTQSKSWQAQLAYYANKFFWVFLVFIAINLLLTIFIRFEVQHKPIIVHSILVIIISLLALMTHPHFIESVASNAVRII